MRKKTIFNLTFALFFSGITSIFAQYSSGIIVANEGNYGSPNAEISYIENGTITNNVYSTANNGEQLGDVLQHIYFYGNKGFLTLNNSNKIVVVNRATFEKITTITTSISQPRSVTVANGKIYTVNNGTSASTKAISVHNLTDYSFIKNISLTASAESIIAVNNKVYVMKSYFGGGNSIEVIDTATDTITNTITLSAGLQSIVTDGNFIYALCSGTASGVSIYKINVQTDIASSPITASINQSKKMSLNNDVLYFVSGGNVYTCPSDLSAITTTPLFSIAGSTWSTFYGFSVIDDVIYSGDAEGFTSNSTIETFTTSGNQLANSYTATMGVNGFYKNSFIPLTTSNFENEIAVILYPNPTSKKIMITNAENAEVTIYNNIGKKVVSATNTTNGIDVSFLQKGMYVAVIKINNTVKTTSFIKN